MRDRTSTAQRSTAQPQETAVRRLLLVEDDPHHRLLFQEVLEEEGYHVDVASCGNEALLAIRQQVPDLVVLDLALPGMRATELLGKLRHLSRALPIVIHSGYLDQHHLQPQEPSARVLKRSDFTELKQTIRALLGRSTGFASSQPYHSH
jgi:DNA-binding response OmpR family regulator